MGAGKGKLHRWCPILLSVGSATGTSHLDDRAMVYRANRWSTWCIGRGLAASRDMTRGQHRLPSFRGRRMWTYVPKADGCHGAPRAGCRASLDSFAMRKTMRKAVPNPVRNPLWINWEEIGFTDCCDGSTWPESSHRPEFDAARAATSPARLESLHPVYAAHVPPHRAHVGPCAAIRGAGDGRQISSIRCEHGAATQT